MLPFATHAELATYYEHSMQRWLVLAMIMAACGDDGNRAPLDGGVDSSVDAAIDANPAAPRLATLTLAGADLSPAFDANTLSYTGAVVAFADNVAVGATTTSPGATITIAGQSTSSFVQATAPNASVDVNIVVSDPATSLSNTYVVHLRRLGDIATLLASNGAGTANQLAQEGLAVSGDGLTMVASTTRETSSIGGIDGASNLLARDSGAAYAFRRGTTGWSEEAKIKMAMPDQDDHFGKSVALSRDGNVLVVGAPGEDSNGVGVDSQTQGNNASSDSGAIYVFRRTGGTWTQANYIKAAAAAQGLGTRVDISDDGTTIAALSTDRLYMFAASGATWVQATPIDAPVGFAAQLGVAVSGDGQRVVVTTQQNSNGDQMRVLHLAGGQWQPEQTIEYTSFGHHWGESLDIDDAGERIVIGAPFEPSTGTGLNPPVTGNASEVGAAWLYTRAGATWTKSVFLKASNSAAIQEFGSSAAIAGDGHTIVIGALREDSNGTGINSNTQSDTSAGDSGAAYVFRDVGGTWAQIEYVKPAQNDGGAQLFGCTSALSDDARTMPIGAYFAHSSDGTVYVYHH